MVTFQRDNMASKRVLLISLSEQQVVTAMLDNGHIRKDMHTQAFIYTREKYCYKGFKTKTEKLLRTNGSICDELTKRCGCESDMNNLVVGDLATIRDINCYITIVSLDTIRYTYETNENLCKTWKLGVFSVPKLYFSSYIR